MGSSPSKHHRRHRHHHRARGPQMPPPGFEPRGYGGGGRMPYGQMQPGQMQGQEGDENDGEQSDQEQEEGYGKQTGGMNPNDPRLLGGGQGMLGWGSGGMNMGLNPNMMQRGQGLGDPPLEVRYRGRHRNKKRGRYGRGVDQNMQAMMQAQRIGGDGGATDPRIQAMMQARGMGGDDEAGGIDPNMQAMMQARGMGGNGGAMDPRIQALMQTRGMGGAGGIRQGGNGGSQMASPGAPNAGLPDLRQRLAERGFSMD